MNLDALEYGELVGAGTFLASIVFMLLVTWV